MTDSAGVQIDTTVKYLPFGGARASVNIPTDKLFTGQRLDSTGLYYYNARYYDPTIGRFISADTMISDPTDPQCFNRYAYCLNNPLKYIDSSGHVVTIGGVDVNDIDKAVRSGDYDAMLKMASKIYADNPQNGDLLIAYGNLRSAAKELTNSMEQSSQVINIKFDPNTGQGGTSNELVSGKWNGNMNIALNDKLDPEFLVTTLAHESFHAGNNLRPTGTTDFVGWDPSLWDESFAYGFGNAVAQKLGYNMANIYAQNGYYNTCAGMNPFTYTGAYFLSFEKDLRNSYGTTIRLWGNHILDILENAKTYWVK
jgi:RHS repeat-associated protein